MSNFDFNFIEQGWQCPICKRVMSPRQDYCIFCANHESSYSTAGTSAGISYQNYLSKSLSEDKK